MELLITRIRMCGPGRLDPHTGRGGVLYTESVPSNVTTLSSHRMFESLAPGVMTHATWIVSAKVFKNSKYFSTLLYTSKSISHETVHFQKEICILSAAVGA